MGLLSELKELKYDHLVMYTAAFFGTVATGFLIIFQFRPELIEKYDVLKLLIFSLALTFPIAIRNIIRVGTTTTFDVGDDVSTGVAFAMCLTALQVYVPILICYFLALRFKWFVIFLVVTEIILLIAGRVHAKSMPAKNKS